MVDLVRMKTNVYQKESVYVVQQKFVSTFRVVTDVTVAK